MSALKKKSETCHEQLVRMCKNIAKSISEPEEITAKEEFGKLEKRTETAHDWMEDVYDIRYIVDREGSSSKPQATSSRTMDPS